jgi:cell wall-associated NlpC family hydrolase
MIGHSLPNEVYDQIKVKGRILIGQEKGKPTVIKTLNDETIAILKFKSDNEIKILLDSERKEMNEGNVIFVTLGSTKDNSEVFFPERYFENRPLVGRPFLHGLFDCYTLVRDYYTRNFNLVMPTNLQRDWEWWNQGPNLYVEHANNYGFENVNDIETHDLLVMSLGSEVPNHGAIYLGENKILHHVAGRFSTIEELSTFYKTKISVVYRNNNIN